MGELSHEEEEAITAEDDLVRHTIPYQDRVLVKLAQAEVGMTPSGMLHEVERQQKYAREALDGTCVRVGKRVNIVRPGDKVWLDRKCWVATARYVIVHEKDILAHEPPSEVPL
jgi:co-chaperonin GroES (HSP10)